MIDSAKSVYLGQTKAPLDDPWIVEWLAGAYPVTRPLAEHLANLTDSEPEYWLALDRGASHVPPAVPVYEVRAVMPRERAIHLGLFRDQECAESCAAEYNASTDRQEDDYRAAVSRRALWLPARPKSESRPPNKRSSQ